MAESAREVNRGEPLGDVNRILNAVRDTCRHEDEAMGMDDMSDVKADLSRRIGAIEWRGGPARIAHEVDAIRSIARRHGMYPALIVAQQLEAALGRGEHGPLVHGWLTLLRDAVASERQDVAAGESYAAACAVRLAS